MSGQTAVEKILGFHAVGAESSSIRAGDVVALRPCHVLSHDNTADILDKFEALGFERVANAAQLIFALDHDLENTSAEHRERYRRIEEFAARQGVVFHPAGAGIGHQLMIERGFAQPGQLCVASDSHANTYGGCGALGVPIVRTDAAVLWATGVFWWRIPETIRVHLEGELPEGVSGKDLALHLCARFSRGEVRHALVEIEGPGLESLDCDDRFTLANLTTEWGAVGAHVRTEEVKPDADAVYAGEVWCDLSSVHPFVSGPDSLHAGTTVDSGKGRRVDVDRAYLLGCANARLSDLQAAADVLRGHRVAPSVRFVVAAASQKIQEDAEADGTWETLRQAGAHFLLPGCGPCIGLGSEVAGSGQIVISATNRNFPGRMGATDAHTYLASPTTVARAARDGHFRLDLEPAPLKAWARRFVDRSPRLLRVPILDGFPQIIRRRGLFADKDSLSTDGIYDKAHVYRSLSPDEMARVVLANAVPEFADVVRPGDILIAGEDFGCGSSREQAVTALLHAEVGAVVAASFAPTFLRNATNHGLVCVSCPEFVKALRHGTRSPVLRVIEVLELDFRAGKLLQAGRRFPIMAPPPVEQRIIAAGGIESMVKAGQWPRGVVGRGV